ncbi:MAG: hypothetical protein CMO81_04030 [Waddliaceae bacterium]|nr:hypothetical protein [Waddliaceae bacterium]
MEQSQDNLTNILLNHPPKALIENIPQSSSVGSSKPSHVLDVLIEKMTIIFNAIDLLVTAYQDSYPEDKLLEDEKQRFQHLITDIYLKKEEVKEIAEILDIEESIVESSLTVTMEKISNIVRMYQQDKKALDPDIVAITFLEAPFFKLLQEKLEHLNH